MKNTENRYYIIVLKRGYIEYIDKDIENGKTEYGTNLLLNYAKKYTYCSACRIKNKLLKEGEPYVKVLEFENYKLINTTTYIRTNKEGEKPKYETDKRDFTTYKRRINELTPKEMASICKGKECKNCPLMFKKAFPRTSICIFTNTREKLNIEYNTDLEYLDFKQREVEVKLC